MSGWQAVQLVSSISKFTGRTVVVETSGRLYLEGFKSLIEAGEEALALNVR